MDKRGIQVRTIRTI